MKKILIIEDEESIRMALEDDFRLENYDVEVASDGIEGLSKAAHPEVDLIILDIMLPGMNGFEICKNLRNQGIKTPIIMLTAKGQEIDRVLGLDLGVKPIFDNRKRLEQDHPESHNGDQELREEVCRAQEKNRRQGKQKSHHTRQHQHDKSRSENFFPLFRLPDQFAYHNAAQAKA